MKYDLLSVAILQNSLKYLGKIISSSKLPLCHIFFQMTFIKIFTYLGEREIINLFGGLGGKVEFVKLNPAKNLFLQGRKWFKTKQTNKKLNLKKTESLQNFKIKSMIKEKKILFIN